MFVKTISNKKIKAKKMGNLEPGKKDQKKKEESLICIFLIAPNYSIIRETVTKDSALACGSKKEEKGSGYNKQIADRYY